MLDQVAFGKRVHERRKAQLLTQEQLGDALGVSAQAVSKWELGESAPDVGLLPELCRTLVISADALLGVEPAIGLESLSEALAERLPRERSRAYEEAVLRVLARLHFVEQMRPPSGDALGRDDAGLRIAYRLLAGRMMSIDLLDPKGVAALVLGEALQPPADEAKLDAMRTLLSPVRWQVGQALLNGPQSEANLCAALGEYSSEEVREAIDALLQANLVVRDRSGYQLDSGGSGALAIAALLRVLSALRPAVTGTTYE